MPVSDPSFVPVTAWVDSSPTTLRVRFSLKPLVNAALTAAGNYSVAGNTVSSVATVADDPFAVKLTLGSAINLKTSALVTIAGGVILDATAAYEIDSPGNTVSIAAPGQAARKPSAPSKQALLLGTLPVASLGVVASNATRKPAPPTITNLIPVPSSTLQPQDAWSFDVTAPSDGLLRVIVSAVLEGLGGAEELIWNGTSFVPGYETSTTSVIANGLHFVVKRTAGWPPGDVHFAPKAFDKSGQVTE
jgi:hypothetical protein